MRNNSLLLALPLLALTGGCTEDYLSPVEACPEFMFGAGDAQVEVRDALTKVSCYRRFAGVQKTNVNQDISAAIQAHSLYLDTNFDTLIQQGGDLFNEDPALPNFTGVTEQDRMIAQGWTVPQQDHYVFSLSDFKGNPDMPSWALIDRFIHEPYYRQVLLQPGVFDAGYGESGDFAGLVMVSNWPTSTPLGRPITWPVDGQTNVPPSWFTEYFNGPEGRYDSLDPFKLYGYPISITIGSDTSNGTPATSTNPLGLTLLSATLTGPEGSVPVVSISPDGTELPLPSSVVVIPERPLEENTTYALVAELGWSSGPADVEFSFTTGAYADE